MRASLFGWVVLGQPFNHSGPVCLQKNGEPSLAKAGQRCVSDLPLLSCPQVTPQLSLSTASRLPPTHAHVTGRGPPVHPPGAGPEDEET